ncbi:hypothetical protein C2W62_27540 [Candidatus Entotheonella serta]|nr:hypothetical protein C2W62_27540 [Candidatus Entotheonella serta]
MNRVETRSCAALWPIALQRNAEPEDLAGGDQLSRLCHHVRRDVVQRPEFIIRTPFAPIAHRQRDLVQLSFLLLHLFRCHQSLAFLHR